MTDHLEAARDRLGGLHDHLSRREAALAADDLHAILSAILDHLEAQQPEPEPDPLGETNHADRIDCVGGRWVWCDDCDGFLMDHAVHKSGIGRSAVWIDERYGPLTFAPQPAEPPATAPQPDEAHGDTPDPARPAERHTARVIKSDYTPTDKFVRDTYAAHRLFNDQPHDTDDTTLGDIRAEFDRWLDGICHEAWGEGYRAGRTDEQDAYHCEAWSDDECGCGHYGASTTPNPYRKDRA